MTVNPDDAGKTLNDQIMICARDVGWRLTAQAWLPAAALKVPLAQVAHVRSALAVADYASYRLPDARVICVTNTSFFSDGSIFAHIGNASTLVPIGTPPEDIAAMVEYYGTRTNGG